MNKLILGTGIIPVILILTPQMVYAWNLTIFPRYMPLGTNRTLVEVSGPLGNTYSQWVQNGVNQSAMFSLPDKEFPSGQIYHICIATERLVKLPCDPLTHGNENDISLACTIRGATVCGGP
jgi:hypothetical protein